MSGAAQIGRTDPPFDLNTGPGQAQSLLRSDLIIPIVERAGGPHGVVFDRMPVPD
jgi:hypothetical protein